MTPESEQDIRDMVHDCGQYMSYLQPGHCAAIQSLEECLKEIDSLREKLAEADKCIELHRENYLAVARIMDKQAEKLKIAEDAIESIAHPSIWLDEGSDGVLKLAEEALSKIRGDK